MMRRWLWLPLLALLLAGCQSNQVRQQQQQLDSGNHANSPANVYIALAVAYLRENNLTVALENAQTAVKKDRSNPNGFNVLGLIYQRLGKAALAEDAWQKALSLAPNDPYTNNAYGSFLCSQKRYEDSFRYFDRAVANPLYQERWVALGNAGLCAHQSGELPAADRYLRRALQANPRHPPALLGMLRVSVAKQKYLSARAYLQRYLEVARHTPETLWLGIQTEQQLGDRDKVASYALLLRSRYADSPEAGKLEEMGI